MKTAALAFATTLLVAGVPVTAGLLEDDVLRTVRIVRDPFGVPHIFADDTYALFYANGYVQAQDRLWELDLLRHVGYGEAASVVGPGGGIHDMDLAVRRDLYTRGELDQMVEDAPEELRFIIEAYTDGVNRAATEMTATGNLPVEFPALQHLFEPWQVRDTLAVATFLLARFGVSGGEEIANAQLFDQLTTTLGADADAAMRDLVWGVKLNAYPTIPAEEGTFGSPPFPVPPGFGSIPDEQKAALAAAADSETFGLTSTSVFAIPPAAPASTPVPDVGLFAGRARPLDFKLGSFAFVVAPSLSADGRAMVGGGPQIGYFNPEVAYEIGLHGPGYDAVGMGIASTPGVIIGRTPNFAWTVTSGISDQVDTIALPAAGDETYLWDGEEIALDCRTEEHLLFTPPATGGPALEKREQRVCNSDLGPVVAVTRGDAGSVAWFFAQRSASRLEEVGSAAQWLSLDTKQNYEEFAEVFEDFAFTFNFNFAGVNAAGEQVGCYRHVGLQPIRHPDLDPRYPTPAGDAWQWQGFLQGADLPNRCNPNQGYFVNWNNLPQKGWPSGDGRELWGSLTRVERLDREVKDFLAQDADHKLTLDEMKVIMENAATHDSLAFEIVPSLLPLMPASAAGAREALELWAADDYPWVDANGDGSYDHPGHTVYDTLATGLVGEVFGDEQGDLTREVHLDPRESSDPHAGDHGQVNNPFAALVDAVRGDTSVDWCNGSCADEVDRALGDLAHAHLLGDIELTEEHRSPFTTLGTGPAYTMPMTNRATYFHFHVGSDSAQSVSALPAGNSGHMSAADFLRFTATGEAPRHMEDQLQMYVDFEFKRVPGDAAAVDAVCASGGCTEQTLVVPPA